MAKSLLIKSNVKPGQIFQYKKGRKFGSVKDLDITKPYEAPKDKEDPPIGLIQGKMPRSILEWRVYLGAVRLDISFRYQVSIRGGSTRRGGMILDFIFYIPPLPKPVFCQGDYWHKVFKNPLVEQTIIDRMMSENKGQFALPLMIWESQVQNADDAYWLLSKELIHG